MKADYIVTMQVGYNEMHFNFKDDSETALTFMTTAFETLVNNEDVVSMHLTVKERENQDNANTDV